MHDHPPQLALSPANPGDLPHGGTGGRLDAEDRVPSPSRFRLLARHFYRRFFDNDLISPAGDAHVGLSHVIGAFLTPGLLVVILVILKYALNHTTWDRVVELAFDDALLYVALSIIVLGIAATLTWDAFFLESRDHYILGMLPVGHRLLGAAKLGALATYLVIFVGAANAIPIALVPVLMLQRVDGASFLHHFVPLTLAHALATLLSGTWAVLTVVALRGLIALVLPHRVFRRVGPLLQGGLILALLGWFVALPQFLASGHAVFEAGGWIRDASPPMWFLGLYEATIGQPQPAFHALARAALLATACTALAVIVLVFATPARRQADVDAAAVVLSARRSRASHLVARLARVLAHPRTRSIFSFTLAGLGRSANHRIYLAGAVGAALAWSASGFIWTYGSQGLSGLHEPGARLLVTQPIVVLFVAAAIRFGVGVPLTLPANWLFRLTEGPDVGPYHQGSRRAALAASVVPVLALLPLHASLWTWDVVAFHLVVGILYAAFVVEFLFHTVTKVPFTAPYVSGSIRLKTRWWLYFCAAWVLTGVPAFYEARALRFGAGGVLLPVGLLGLTGGLAVVRRVRERDALGLTFEELPDDTCQKLGLSE